MRDVVIDGGDQFGHAREHTAAQPFHRDVPKEPLNHVQPRRRGRREMHVDARPFGKAALHGGMLVGGVIVGDQVQRPSQHQPQAIHFAQERSRYLAKSQSCK